MDIKYQPFIFPITESIRKVKAINESEGNIFVRASQVALEVKNPHANAGDVRDAGLIPGSGKSPGGGPDNPLHYCCLENPMDRGAWRATVHRVAQSWT